MAQEKTQRTFYINPKSWADFQKQSIDLGTNSSARIEKFIEDSIKFHKNGGETK